MIMTPEQQRVAIAEWCGWKRRQLGSVYVYYQDSVPDGMAGAIPDYCNDLNACFEFEERVITDASIGYEYDMMLCLVTGAYRDEPKLCNHLRLWHATAAQRAEALCRVLWPERWKEDSK